MTSGQYRLIKEVTMVTAVLVFLSSTQSVHADSAGEIAGDVGQVAIPASAFAATYLVGDGEGRIQFYRSFLSAIGITYALKYAVDRDRPEGHGENAFPSGHTAAAFQGAVFIQRRYGWSYGVPACLGAAFVGWSRIEAESDKHDILDVLAGAVLGSLMSYCLTTSYKEVQLVTRTNRSMYTVSIMARW
jgi:membrane-associated phospholipid phosphatase